MPTRQQPLPQASPWRILRATVRDWWVLFREFRWPLALLLLVSELVALLFYHFYTHPLYPQGLALDEALYAVMTLTVIEAAVPTPEGSGHWLIVFYFLMPFVGLFLASQGLANFIALLFNRRARGAAWLDAVASTYQGHVVVCGLGHVGSRVVESLRNAGAEIIGVEQHGTLDTAGRVRAMGITVIEGDIRQTEVLRRAGITRARAVVICTDNDMANLEAAFHCRELNPTIRLIVRLFDAELARRVKASFNIDEAFSASALAAPIFAGAALEVEVDRTFSIGDDVLSVSRLTVASDGKLCGRTVGDIENRLDCSIIVHEREGLKDIHPLDTTILNPHDCIMVLADFPTIHRLASLNGKRR